MDDNDAKKFFETAMNYPDIRIKTAMILFLLTGFRRGEVCGLEWKDIDMKNNSISVNRIITSVQGYGLIEKEPKTSRSQRQIAVSEILIAVLKEYKEYQDNLKKNLGDYMECSDKVFTQYNGKILHPSTFTFWLKKVLKEAGLEHVSLHSLRHTNITLQISSGVPLVTVSARAGHARASTTTDVYAHFIKSNDKEAANKLDKIFVDNSLGKKDIKSKQNDLFDQVKYEKERLGFETFDEYFNYLEFKQTSKKKKEIEME